MRRNSVALHTLGCKVNQAEADLLASRIARLGLTLLPFDGEADYYIVNTCAVTGEAERKSGQLIRQAVKRSPGATVIVTGCFVQRAGEAEVLRRLLQASPMGEGEISRLCTVPQEKKEQIPAMIEAMAARVELQAERAERIRGAQGSNPSSWLPRTRAFLKIQDGCDYRCSFCIVPGIRGRSRSLDPQEVLRSVSGLFDAGHREVVLAGIALGSYGRDLSPRVSLAALLQKLSLAAPQGTRIRLSSLDPSDLSEEILQTMTDGPFAPHFHLPLQHGSNRILRLMGRRYTAEKFKEKVALLRSYFPVAGITTDIMTGFPGEEDLDHLENLRVAEETGFSRLHVFPYSPRPGTRASCLPGQVPRGMKKKRVRELVILGRRLSTEFHGQFLGRKVQVLVEHERDEKTGLLQGYSEEYIRCLFPGSDGAMGSLSTVRLVQAKEECTLGE